MLNRTLSTVTTWAVGLLGAAGVITGNGDSLTTGPADDSTRVPSPVDRLLYSELDREGVISITPPATDPDEVVKLGRMLFFDKELSGNRNISCASCHHPNAAAGDGLSLPVGQGGSGEGLHRKLVDGAIIPRNSPTALNAGLDGMHTMFWDGRLRHDPEAGAFWTPEPRLNGASPALAEHVRPLTSALDAQAMFPPTSADEMRGLSGENELADAPSNEAVWRRIMVRLVGDGTPGSGIEEYRQLFRNAYPEVGDPRKLTFGHAAAAIGAFERDAFTALGSRFDRYLTGDVDALSEREKRGGLLFFGDAGCARCHSGPLLTDLEFHALGVPQIGPGKSGGDDLGRAEVTGKARDAYRFRTPPLRNVAITGPWMHDGAFTDLADAVRHHLDPVASALAFDEAQLPATVRDLRDPEHRRRRARVGAIELDMLQRSVLDEEDVADLVLFLSTLTDPGALDLGHLVPERVPSGLPVNH